MEGAKLFKDSYEEGQLFFPTLKTIYGSPDPIPHRQLVVCVHNEHVLSERVINDSQRQAAQRLFKGIKRGPIVKVESHRWVLLR